MSHVGQIAPCVGVTHMGLYSMHQVIDKNNKIKSQRHRNRMTGRKTNNKREEGRDKCSSTYSDKGRQIEKVEMYYTNKDMA